MRDELLTISALAARFHRDRRTIERRLAGVEPERTEPIAGRTSRLYRLSVVEPLLAAESESDTVLRLTDELHEKRAAKLKHVAALRRGELVSVDAMNRALAAWVIATRAQWELLARRTAPGIADANSDDTLSDAQKLEARGRALDDGFAGILAAIQRPFAWDKEQH